MRHFGRFIAAAAATALVTVPGSAFGELDPGAAAKSAEPTVVVQPIDASTTFAHPVSDAFPAGVMGIANPSLICIFAPCPPEAADVILLISDPLGQTRDIHGQATPFQALQPGTAAVSLTLGSVQFESALKFTPPTLPDGQQYDDFTMVLDQTDPTFNANSPSFRDVLDAIFITYRDENPEAAAAKLQSAITNAPIDQKVLEIQVCPLLAPFESTEAPAVSQGADVPRDEFGSIDAACYMGAFGEYDGAGAWSFDLTRTANAWADGELENNGLFLRPVVTNYLGIGDEDLSTNAQTTLLMENVTLLTTLRATSPGFTYPVAPTPAAPVAEGASPAFTAPAPSLPAEPSTEVTPAVSTEVADPQVAPAPEFAPDLASGFDADAFADVPVSDWLPLTALLLIVGAGTGAYNLVRRRRVRPSRLLTAD